MIIHRNGEAMAALGASALEDDTPVSGGHALAETMHANAAANFRLISALCHEITFLSISNVLTSIPLHAGDVSAACKDIDCIYTSGIIEERTLLKFNSF